MLLQLLRHGFQGLEARGLALPGDLPTVGPQGPLSSRRVHFEDLHAEALSRTKELAGDAEAQHGLTARCETDSGLPAAEGTDGVAVLDLATRTLATGAQGDLDRDEAGVGADLAGRHPASFHCDDVTCLSVGAGSYASRAGHTCASMGALMAYLGVRVVGLPQSTAKPRGSDGASPEWRGCHSLEGETACDFRANVPTI